MGAGGLAALIGTPAEISLIRMCADGRLPKEQQRGYSSVFNALYRISKEEGVATLWRVSKLKCVSEIKLSAFCIFLFRTCFFNSAYYMDASEWRRTQCTSATRITLFRYTTTSRGVNIESYLKICSC